LVRATVLALVILLATGCAEQVAGVDGGTNGNGYCSYRLAIDELLLFSDYVALGRPVEARKVLFEALATAVIPPEDFFFCTIFSVATIDTLNVAVRQDDNEEATPPWGDELATYHDECMRIAEFERGTQNLLAYPTALFFAQNNIYLNRPYLIEMLEVVDSKVKVGPSNTRCGVALEIEVTELFDAVAVGDFSALLEADTYPCRQNDGAAIDDPDGSDGSEGK